MVELNTMLVCTTEALEIKGAANSVSLQRILAFRSAWVRFRSVWVRFMSVGLEVYGFPRTFCGTNRLHYTHSAV